VRATSCRQSANVQATATCWDAVWTGTDRFRPVDVDLRRCRTCCKRRHEIVVGCVLRTAQVPYVALALDDCRASLCLPDGEPPLADEALGGSWRHVSLATGKVDLRDVNLLCLVRSVRIGLPFSNNGIQTCLATERKIGVGCLGTWPVPTRQ
jgi:hypothetical protein